jgi:N-carbamoyl-L-amino-acid hydrolase
MRNLCCFVLLMLCPFRGHAQSANSTFHINSQRLQGTLEKLSEFGRNPEGGATRLGFSETDLAARDYVMQLMKQAGLGLLMMLPCRASAAIAADECFFLV